MTTFWIVPPAVLLALVSLLSNWGNPSHTASGRALTPSAARGAVQIPRLPDYPLLAQGHQLCSWLGYFGESQILVGTADGLVQNTGAGWQVIFPWPGGHGYAADHINVAPNGTIYVLFTYPEPGSLYRSTDSGRTWELRGEVPQGVGRVFASPVPDLIFAGVPIGAPPGDPRYGVYRSTDGGASWQRVLGSGDYAPSVACSPDFAQDGTAFAALAAYKTSVGVWKTTDWGVTWTSVNNGLYQGLAQYGYAWVEVSPQYPQDQTAFTLDWHGIYQTTSGGAPWTRVFSSTYPAPAFTSGMLSPRYPQDWTLLMSGYDPHYGLWLSQDDGHTWQIISPKDVGTFGIRGSGPLAPPPTPMPTPGPLRTYLPLASCSVPPWQVYLPIVRQTALELWMVATDPGFPYTGHYLYRSTNYGATWELKPVEY